MIPALLASFSSSTSILRFPSKNMKRLIFVAAFVTLFSFSATAQVTNETLQARIRAVGAEKSITLTFDPAGKTSKIMAVSDNFSKSDASRAGLLAMNFAMGIIYAGDTLERSPETFLLTFWVMSKKPRFGENHSMTAALKDEMLVIGSARYAAKPREQMEYLNFELSRASLAKIAAEANVRFQLGNEEFTFTPSQMKLFADLVTVTEK